MTEVTDLALGCMRLSTDEDRDDERSVRVIHAALDSGVTLLDSADSYALDDTELHHNERLIRRALDSYPGDTNCIRVATKGGLMRPGGKWVPNGKAKHLKHACEGSLKALDQTCIDLYQLHAPDPAVDLETSLRALRSLQRQGLVRRLGLCNVNRMQLLLALELIEVSTVQVGFSFFDDEALAGGVIEACLERDIQVLAHSPLGGPKKRRRVNSDARLKALAQRYEVPPGVIALAWLHSLNAGLVPLPGARRVETAQSLTTAARLRLDSSELAELDQRLPSIDRLRRPRPVRQPAEKTSSGGEVVLVMGIQGAGKSSTLRTWLDRGYQRLNRDQAGGTLAKLNRELQQGLARGDREWVLDNTYASRAARGRVIDLAWQYDTPVRCVWLETPLAEAQVNAVRRLLRKYGELPGPADLRRLSRNDPHAFDPQTQHRFERELEPPSANEGFSQLDVVPFRREPSPYDGKALVLPLELLHTSRSGQRAPLDAADQQVQHRWAPVLKSWHERGYTLLAVGWYPEVSAGKLDEPAVQTLLDRLGSELEVPVRTAFCPHGGGPPRCWCRPPLPGLLVQLCDELQIDPAQSVFVGATPTDQRYAQTLGMSLRDPGKLVE